MKNYTSLQEDGAVFIKKYKIAKDKKTIIIYLGDGAKYVIPNTIKNEESIKEKMINQVSINKKTYMKEIKKKADKLSVLLLAGVGCTVLLSILVIMKGTLLFNVALVGEIISNVICATKIAEQKSLLKDIEKQVFFLANEDTLNNNIRTNDNVLLGVSSKAERLVCKSDENKLVFDINTIDSFSLEDLKKIKENIERSKYFGFDENTKGESSDFGVKPFDLKLMTKKK